MTPSLDELADVSWLLWAWAAAALVLTAALGFGAGVWHERSAPRRTLRQAQKSLADLFALATKRLDAAAEVCGWIERHPLHVLSDEQAFRLERTQTGLMETLGRVFARRTGGKPESDPRKTLDPFSVTWVREPLDAAGYPSRAAFEASLDALVEACRRSETSSGILLARIDRFDAIQSRFGQPGAERLALKLGSVVCRAIRDEDLVCRLGDDAYAVLLPDVDDESGRRLAEAIRNSVRHHHFRIEESGPEVLVTASFGYAPCEPYDNADLILNRAGDALAKSQRRGRNQLHVHDGRQLIASAAT